MSIAASPNLRAVADRLALDAGAAEQAGNFALRGDCRGLACLSHDRHNNLNCIGLHLKLLNSG
jgi:hypothetical protein